MFHLVSRWVSVALLTTLCAASNTQTSAQTRVQTIPPIHAEALAGNTVILPDDFHHRTAVLVLGFSKSSQDQVTAWGKRLSSDYRDSPTIVFYEMAMLASVPLPVRGFVIRSMKKSVPERLQPRFLPLTTDEDAWHTLTRYRGGDSAYLLVVDPTGSVLWQTHGSVTDAAFAELKRHLP